MTLQERKDILLNHSATEVRNSRALFAEFVFIYTSEGGNKRDCMSCNFKSVFQKWKSNTNEPLKIKTMSEKKNTFKLKNEKEMIAIPFTGKVITKDSPDEWVLEFIDQEDGKYREKRIERFFESIPQEEIKEKPLSKMSKTELEAKAKELGVELTDAHTNNQLRAKAIQDFLDSKK